ncbi:hypothetical protein SSS_03425 [Sarcoptes scabiei]|nr:hypothetical protein SSS_03425 [Sarcoptes scabiei]
MFNLNLCRSLSRTLILKNQKENQEKNGRKLKSLKRQEKLVLRQLRSMKKENINPHIPQYISTTPWYFGASGPTLKHQKVIEDKNKDVVDLHSHYVRGVRGSTATKYRKGACENCGAMGHKRKDCFERPRKIMAIHSGRDIAADDIQLPQLKFDYDGKRDRWNGYDAVMYQSVIDEHQKVEKAKQILKEEKLKQDLLNDENDSDDSDEDEKYADHIDMPGTKVDSKQRITVRNLRIREDTAKYLRNLDLDSAYYDPKTRSMRDNPYKKTGKNPDELQYAGDNFVRYTGETSKVSEAQLFAWEVAEKGIDVHLQAEPTKAEIIHRELDQKKDNLKNTIKESILKKYC